MNKLKRQILKVLSRHIDIFMPNKSLKVFF